MATIKSLNGQGKYRDEDAKYDVINYILSPDKVVLGCCGGYGVDVYEIAGSMEQVSERFGKTTGVQLRHFVISFLPNELNNPKIANDIAIKMSRFFAQEYQVVFAVHGDKPHLHIHIVINSVSYVDGHRFYGNKHEFYNIMNTLKRILKNYGITQPKYISHTADI